MRIIILTLTFFLSLGLFSFAADRPSNEIPMYGGDDKSHIAPNKEHSKGLSQLGWEYLAKGDIDTAIKRFNQAWMFDHENVSALWGFGAVMGSRSETEEPIKNLKESVRFLRMANKIASTNARLINDLAYSHIMLGKVLQDINQHSKIQYLTALQLLEKAKTIRPSLPIIYFNHSLLEFYTENYIHAKDLLNKAISLGFTADPSYQKALNEKL